MSDEERNDEQTAATEEEEEPISMRLPPFLSGLLFTIGVLFVARALAGLIDHHFWRSLVLGGILLTCYEIPYLRKSMLQSLAVLLVGCLVVVLWRNAGDLAAGRSGGKEVAEDFVALTTGFGPGKQVVGIVKRDKKKGKKKNSEGPAEHLEKARNIEYHRPQLRVFTPRHSDVNNTAAQVTRGCGSKDQLCQATLLIRFVTNEIEYRFDPTRKREREPDYIKSPAQTLKAMAGDCEDQAILVVSLLESLRIRTLMVSEPGHRSAMVCFERRIRDAIMEAYEQGGWKAVGYLRNELPAEPEQWDRELNRLCEITVTDEDGRKYCYPVEGTDEDSWLTNQPDWEAGVVLVDPVEELVLPRDTYKLGPACAAPSP